MYTTKRNLDYHLTKAKIPCLARICTDYAPDQNDPLKCTICNIKYVKKGNLTRHLKNIHKFDDEYIHNSALTTTKTYTNDRCKNDQKKSDLRKTEQFAKLGAKPAPSIYPNLGNVYTCPFCSVDFTRNSSLKRHIRNKICDELNSDESTIINNTNYGDNNTIHGTLDNSQDNRQINNTNNTIVNNNNNTPTLNNQNMYLLTYGNEGDDEWEDDEYKKYIRKGIHSVSSFIEDVHFNPDHPERQNVYLKNRTGKNIEVYKKGRWVERSADDVIRDMCNDKMDILSYCYDDNEEELLKSKKKSVIRAFNRTAYGIDNKDPETLDDQNLLIRTIMHDNREMVDANRKKRRTNSQYKLHPNESFRYKALT